MTATDTVELLVVGGGKAGKSIAVDWARAGRRVAMIERGMIGGSCINVACIPTKSLVASARAFRTVRRAAELGISVPDGAHVDLDLLRAHKEGVVGDLVTTFEKQFQASGMDLVLGQARFVDERTVEVALDSGGIRRIRGDQVVINTGTEPFLPPVDGLAEANPLTSNSLLQLDRLPERLLVLGGGYIGCEFAQMLAAFGSSVTILQSRPTILDREDSDISGAVTDLFTADGIDIRTGISVASVSRQQDGTVAVRLADGGTLRGDDLLAAVGRSAVTAELDLTATGVKTDARGFVVVDEFLRTTADNIWAAGDVARSPQFTHVSNDDARIVAANLAGGNRSTAHRLIPYTVFLTPELGRVGMTESQAIERGHDVRVACIPVAAIPRARTLRETAGIWKAVVDARTDLILGAALLGPEAGEVITTVQMAMIGGLPYTALRDAIINHPTMAEGLGVLFGSLGD